NGTAVYYPLQSVAYGPFPRIADLLTHFALPVVIATYATVLAQIAFPFLLFHRVTRRFALVILLGMHLSIAVLMGLPFFSGIMASADAVLVSGTTWVAIVTWLRTAAIDNPVVRRLVAALPGRRRRAGEQDAAQTDEVDRASADEADATPATGVDTSPADGTDAPAREGAPVRQDAASRL